MAQPQLTQDAGIPRARSGPITDLTLSAAADVADAIARGEDITNEAGALLLTVTGPLLRELELRRRAARMVEDIAASDNIVRLERL